MGRLYKRSSLTVGVFNLLEPHYKNPPKNKKYCITLSLLVRGERFKMVQVLDNSMINVELFPGKKDGGASQQAPADGAAASAQSAGTAAQAKADGAVETTKETAESTANTAQNKTAEVQSQASETASSWSDTAQQKARDVQDQAAQYQSTAADTVRGYGDTAEQQGNQYVQSGADYAKSTATSNLPESTHGYAGAAVDYASNFATGTVGTVAGGLKDVGDTVGNAGYQTVAGVGKTGYNLGSGIGNAAMGKKTEEAATAEDATTTTS